MPDDKEKGRKKTPKEMELQRIKKFYEDYVFPLYDHAWKRYMKDSSLRERYLKDWQTNIFTSITQKLVDVMYASVYNAKIGYEVKGRDQRGVETENAVRDLLDYFFEIAKGREVIQTFSFEAMVTGKGYMKTFWNEEKECAKRTQDGKKKEYVLKEEKNPSFRAISSYNLLIDPIAEDIDGARFVYELDFLTMEKAFKKYRRSLATHLGKEPEETTKEDLEKIIKEKNKEMSKDKIIKKDDSEHKQPKMNFAHIKQRIMMAQAAKEKHLLKEGARSFLVGSTNNQAVPTPDSISIEFEKGTYEFAERWSDKKLTIFCNEVELFTVDNPAPFRGKPYEEVYFKKVPLTVFGIGIPYTVSDAQDISNILWNLKIDSAKIYGVPSFTRKRTTPGELYDGDSTLDVSPGKVFPVTEEGELKPLISAGHAQNVQLLRDELKDLDSEAKESVGVNEYVLGSQGKVERSAAAVKTLVQSFNIRLKPYVSSLNNALSNVAYKWMMMFISWGPDKFMIPTVDEDSKRDVQAFTIEDIVGQHHFSFEMESLANLNRELEKEQLVEVLPVLQNFIYNPKTGEPIVDVEKIVRYFMEKFNIPAEKLLAQEVVDTETEDVLDTIQQALAPQDGGVEQQMQQQPPINNNSIDANLQAEPSLPGEVPGQL
jgi:hypothetical protein